MNTNIHIRNIQAEDCEIISRAFQEQGWSKPAVIYQRYLTEQKLKKRLVLVAFVNNSFAGYLTILWRSNYLYFLEQHIPEITDLNVLIKYQNHKLGTKLMDYGENLISKQSGIIGIGVGVTKEYAKAQRMYIKRGYIPDGNGLVQNNRPIVYGDDVTVDDNLILYFTKKINDEERDGN